MIWTQWNNIHQSITKYICRTIWQFMMSSSYHCFVPHHEEMLRGIQYIYSLIPGCIVFMTVKESFSLVYCLGFISPQLWAMVLTHNVELFFRELTCWKTFVWTECLHYITADRTDRMPGQTHFIFKWCWKKREKFTSIARCCGKALSMWSLPSALSWTWYTQPGWKQRSDDKSQHSIIIHTFILESSKGNFLTCHLRYTTQTDLILCS